MKVYMSNKIKYLFLAIFTILNTLTSYANNATLNISQSKKIVINLVDKYCMDCHDGEHANTDLDLYDIFKQPEDRLAKVINGIEEQVYLGQMPPKKKKQPSSTERKSLLNAIKIWREVSGVKSLLADKLKRPEFGNYLDHNKLFSGEYKHLKPFTYDRRWLISEHIFKQKVKDLIQGESYTIDGERKSVKGGLPVSNMSNPFLLSKNSGVRYFANKDLNSSHFASMLENADVFAKRLINRSKGSKAEIIKRHKKWPVKGTKTFLPSIHKITEKSDRHNAILSSRRTFMTNFIERICQDIYKSENEKLLPEFTPIVLKENRVLKYQEEPAPFINKVLIPPPDGSPIALVLRKFAKADLSYLEILRKAEKYWVYRGEAKDVIERRVDILRRFIAYCIEKKSRHWKNMKLPIYKPLEASEMQVIKSAIKANRTKGMNYKVLIQKCLDQWGREFKKEREKSKLEASLLEDLISELSDTLYKRQISADEKQKYSNLFNTFLSKVDEEDAVKSLIQVMIMNDEFIVRNEVGTGVADEHGRRILSARDASYAIAYAITDSTPDPILMKAAQEGRLNTKEDYKREVSRLLKDRSKFYVIDHVINSMSSSDSITTMPIRKLRFFREFFGYDNALSVFKDQKRFGAKLEEVRERLISEADLLVEHILNEDKNVFEELLTTDKFFVFHTGDNQSIFNSSNKLKKFYYYFKKNNWKNIKTIEALNKHKEALHTLKLRSFYVSKKNKPDQVLKNFISFMEQLERSYAGNKQYIAPPAIGIGGFRYAYSKRITAKRHYLGASAVIKHYGLDLNSWDYPPVQPAKIKHRMGILTHPAWLQAFSQNTHNDPVTRGKWIREKLLAGLVPDLPIDVEAKIPHNHTQTLRQRLDSVTRDSACWKCHKYMNPLGNTFEMYDDFGRYRTMEELEDPKNVLNAEEEKKVHHRRRGTFRLRYKSVPVDATGVLDGTGDSKLDGPVKDAHDLISRLVQSSRVRQSIIRHAFRYFIGRNEMLSDSKTLIEADQAYLNSGGSFDAVIISLLSSDSFIYRKELKE